MNHLGINITSGKYATLFRVHFEHEFYNSEGIPDFIPIPTKESMQLIQRFGLLFRNTNDGFVLLYEKAPWKKISLEKLLSNQELRFTFFVRNRNPYFINFSHLPFEMQGQAYYFSNVTTSQIDNKILLHPSSKVTENELIAFSSKKMTFEAKEESMKLSLRDVFGRSHYEEELLLHGNKFNVELNHVPSGRYGIYNNNEKYRDVFLSDEKGKKPFAIIEIALEEGKNSVLNGVEIQTQNYYVSFASRKVYWRYLLTRNQMDRVVDISILDRRKTLDFYCPDKPVVFNNQEMVSIESTKAVTLSYQQLQQLSFKAKKKKNGTGKLTNIMIDLPLPSYKKLNPVNEELVYADVFISL